MSEFDSQYIQDYLQKTTNIDKDSFNNNYNNQLKFQSDFSKKQNQSLQTQPKFLSDFPTKNNYNSKQMNQFYVQHVPGPDEIQFQRNDLKKLTQNKQNNYLLTEQQQHRNKKNSLQSIQNQKMNTSIQKSNSMESNTTNLKQILSQKTIEIQDNFKDKDKNDYLLSSVKKQIRKKTIEKIQKSIYKKSLREYKNQMEDFKNKQEINNSFKTALTQRAKNLSQEDQQQQNNYNICSKTLMKQNQILSQYFGKFDLPQNQQQQQQQQNNSVMNNSQQQIEKIKCSKPKQNPNISLTSISSNYEIDNFSHNSYQQMLPYLFSPKPSNAKKLTQY